MLCKNTPNSGLNSYVDSSGLYRFVHNIFIVCCKADCRNFAANIKHELNVGFTVLFS